MSQRDNFLELLVSLEAGMNTVCIFIAVCDEDAKRRGIISDYERELAPVDICQCSVDLQDPSPRRTVLRVGRKSDTVFMILGAEKLTTPKQLADFYGYLQWTREGFREINSPIVLWITTDIYEQIKTKAPDFWSWRNGVFHF